MSSFIDVIETFEIPILTAQTYGEKIDGLLSRFPRFNCIERYRIALPQKYPKTADDYVSMKFCVMGRVPVYGIYNRSDLQLIAVCVEKILYAIDDYCDLDPNLVPDLTFQRLNLGIRHSSLAVSQSLSYTKKTMCSAISMLSLGYTPDKKDEWIDAFVLLRGITTQAVRFSGMHAHVQSAFHKSSDAEHIPHEICLTIQPKWRQVSKAIREGKLPYLYKYYDVYDGKVCNTAVSSFSYSNSVQLIDYGDKTKGKKICTTNDDLNGQGDRSKIKSKYEKITGQAALVLGATQKLNFGKTKSLELCGTSEAAFPGMLDVTRRTLAAAVLGARQKLDVDNTKSLELCGTSEVAYPGMLDVFRITLSAAALRARQKLYVDKFNSTESGGTSESAYSGMSNLFRRALAAAAYGATQKTSMKDLCFDHQFGMSREEKDPQMVKGDQEHRELLQLGCEPMLEALGATSVYPLQDTTRMEDQHYNVDAPHSFMSIVFRRTLGHEGLNGLRIGLFSNVLQVVSSARAPTKVKPAIVAVAKGLSSKK